MLWVLLIALFYLTHTFDPVLIPKILALVLITFSFVVLARTLMRNDELGPWIVLVGLCLIALQPAFVIWSSSGLENPLFVFLIASLFAMTASDLSTLATGKAIARKRMAGAGILAAAIAVTRPDGLIYLVAYPGAMLGFYLRRLWIDKRTKRPSLNLTKGLALYGISYGAIFGAFLTSRVVHFHQLWPNTYYAKGGPTLTTLSDILLLRPKAMDQLLALLETIAVWPTLWALLLPLAATSYLLKRGELRPTQVLLLWFLLISTGGYLLLPQDWMPWFRFATPVYVFSLPVPCKSRCRSVGRCQGRVADAAGPTPLSCNGSRSNGRDLGFGAGEGNDCIFQRPDGSAGAN